MSVTVDLGKQHTHIPHSYLYNILFLRQILILVVQASLKLMAMLPSQAPKCWDDRQEPASYSTLCDDILFVL